MRNLNLTGRAYALEFRVLRDIHSHLHKSFCVCDIEQFVLCFFVASTQSLSAHTRLARRIHSFWPVFWRALRVVAVKSMQPYFMHHLFIPQRPFILCRRNLPLPAMWYSGVISSLTQQPASLIQCSDATRFAHSFTHSLLICKQSRSLTVHMQADLLIHSLIRCSHANRACS